MNQAIDPLNVCLVAGLIVMVNILVTFLLAVGVALLKAWIEDDRSWINH